MNVLLVIWLACAGVAGLIGISRTGHFWTYFFLGLLLGFIGIILAAIAKPPVPSPSPPGWYADPWQQAPLRWYDGQQWSWHIQNTQGLTLASGQR